MRTFEKRNFIVLANHISSLDPQSRTIIVSDYSTSNLYYLSIEETKSQTKIPTTLKEFNNIEKCDVISVEVSAFLEDNANTLIYNPNSLEFCGSSANIKKIFEKYKNVKSYRNVNDRPYFNEPIFRSSYISKRFENLATKDGIFLLKIRNQKIFLDRKKRLPKFLYKQKDGTFYHLFIEEAIEEHLIDRNFSGYLVLKVDGNTGIKRVISIIGDIKNDEVTGKENNWLKKETQQKEKTNAKFQIKCMEEHYMFKLTALVDVLIIKYGNLEEVVNLLKNINQIEINYQAIRDSIDKFDGDFDKCVVDLFGENFNYPQVLRVYTSLLGGDLSLDEDQMDNFESITNHFFKEIDSRSLFAIYNEVFRQIRQYL